MGSIVWKIWWGKKQNKTTGGSSGQLMGTNYRLKYACSGEKKCTVGICGPVYFGSYIKGDYLKKKKKEKKKEKGVVSIHLNKNTNIPRKCDSYMQLFSPLEI